MDMVDSFFNQLKQRFPNIYKQMITERVFIKYVKLKNLQVRSLWQFLEMRMLEE